MPALLRPMAPTAADAILCGDPARALAIAQQVIDGPRMSNHHRGLWGYHGRTRAGRELTVHATGIGGPSAAIVLDELARRGLKRAVRVGTASAVASAPAIGSIATAAVAVAGDGASVAWGARAGERLEPDPALTERLIAATGLAVTVQSSDRPAERPDANRSAPVRGLEPERGPGPGGVTDLQSAALLAAGRALDVRVAIGLVVVRGGDGPLEDDPLEAASLRLATMAATALDDDSASRGPS